VSAAAPDRPRVEVHVLDFEGDLYGHKLEMVFLGRLREEKRMAGLADLRAQIANDVARARAKLAELAG
jgi:riboflavin kinase/FMN adenylyltransferase